MNARGRRPSPWSYINTPPTAILMHLLPQYMANQVWGTVGLALCITCFSILGRLVFGMVPIAIPHPFLSILLMGGLLQQIDAHNADSSWQSPKRIGHPVRPGVPSNCEQPPASVQWDTFLPASLVVQETRWLKRQSHTLRPLHTASCHVVIVKLSLDVQRGPLVFWSILIHHPKTPRQICLGNQQGYRSSCS